MSTKYMLYLGISRQLFDFDLLHSKKNEQLQKQLEHQKEELELFKVTSYTCVFKEDLASTSCNKACATCCEQKPIETKFGFVLFVIKESNYTVSLRIIPSPRDCF